MTMQPLNFPRDRRIVGAAPHRPGATIQNFDLVSPRSYSFRERFAHANSHETLQIGPMPLKWHFPKLRLHKKEIHEYLRMAIMPTTHRTNERSYHTVTRTHRTVRPLENYYYYLHSYERTKVRTLLLISFIIIIRNMLIIYIFGIAMPMLHDPNSQKCNNHLVSFIKVEGLFIRPVHCGHF